MKKTILAVALSVAAATTLQAKVQAWWRFNSNSTTAANVAGTTVPAMGARVVTTWGNSAAWKNTETETLKFSTYDANPFEPAAVMADPRAKTRTADAAGCRHWAKGVTNCGWVVAYDATKTKPLLQVQKFTVEAIFRMPESPRNGNAIFPLFMHGRDAVEGYLLGVYMTGGNYYPYFRGCHVKSTTVSMYPTGAANNVADAKWHHLAVVVDAAGGAQKANMYLDHALVKSMTITNMYFAAGHHWIGVNPYNVGRAFEGDIAEVRISDEALTVWDMIRPAPQAVPSIVDADTAFYLPLGDADLIGRPPAAGYTNLYWNLSNCATNNPLYPRWYLGHTSAASYPSVRDRDPRANLYDLTSEPSTTSRRTLKGNGESALGSVIQMPDVAGCAGTNDFTLEFFVKCAPTNFARALYNGTWGKWFIYSTSATAAGKLMVRTYWGKTTTGKTEDTLDTRIDDGAWHHLAMVYHGSAAEPYMEFFLDGKRKVHRAGTLYDQNDGANGGNNFLMAEHRTSQGFNGDLDDVRFTRRALTPQEFLSTKQKAILNLDFEAGTCAATNEVQAVDLTPTASARGEKNTAPAVVALDRAGVTQAGGVTVANAKALDLKAGKVIFPKTDAFSRDNFTVEFFAKLKSVQNGSSILSLAQGEAGGTAIWSINVSGTFNVNLTMFVNGTNNSATITPAAEIVDGLWHHWAVQFSKTSDKVTWTAYIDGVLKKTQTHHIAGSLDYPADGLCSLAIGARGTWFDGEIDNLRVLPGVVDIADLQSFQAVGSHIRMK